MVALNSAPFVEVVHKVGGHEHDGDLSELRGLQRKRADDDPALGAERCGSEEERDDEQRYAYPQ